MIGMKRREYGLWIVVFSIFAFSCQQMNDFLEQPANKTIVITDSDSEWLASIRNINGKDVFLALFESQPNVNLINVSAMIKSVYSIGNVAGNRIDLKLHYDGLDYWRGNGDYWVVFALLEPGNRISGVYSSIQSKSFSAERTYMTNTDFIGPVPVNININGVLPF
jgi:hypothetical protein